LKLDFVIEYCKLDGSHLRLGFYFHISYIFTIFDGSTFFIDRSLS